MTSPDTGRAAVLQLVATARTDGTVTAGHRRAQRGYLLVVGVERRASASAAPRTRARSSRSPRRAAKRATASKAASDGPAGPPRIIVNLGPPNLEACRRLARLLVQQATEEVLSRLGAQHNEAPTAVTARAPEEKVT